MEEVFAQGETFLTAYLALDSYWGLAVAFLAILIITLRNRVITKKINGEKKWSDSDKIKGWQYAYNNYIPLSQSSFAITSILTAGGILGGYGTYLAFSEGTLLDQFLEAIFYALLLIAGIMANIHAWKLNRFKKNLKSFFGEWVRGAYPKVIDNAQLFFGKYAFLKLPENHERFDTPFIYVRTYKDKGKSLKHIDSKLRDSLFIKGVFPTKEKSFFIYPKGNYWFRLNLGDTLYNHFAYEFSEEEETSSEGSQGLYSKMLNMLLRAGYFIFPKEKISPEQKNLTRTQTISDQLEDVNLTNIMSNLGFSLQDLEGHSHEESPEKLDPPEEKLLYLSCDDEESFEEHFYDRVRNVENSKSGIVLKYPETQVEIPTTGENSKSEKDRLMSIRSKVLEKVT